MEKEPQVKTVFRWILAILMIAVGALHFIDAQFFLNIVPDYLPWPLALVYISGVFEILGGIGLLVPMTRKAAAWGLIALYICVFPANIHHAVHNIPINGKELHPVLLWGRLPMQIVPILWAWWMTRPSPTSEANEEK